MNEIDKLGVTRSSPVPPIKSPAQRQLALSVRTTDFFSHVLVTYEGAFTPVGGAS